MKKIYTPAALQQVLTVEKLYSLHYFAYLKNFSFEGESHDFWELIFCDSGSVRIYDRDRQFLLSQGQAFLHAPGNFHNVRPEKADTNVIVTGFGGKLDILHRCAGKPVELSQAAKHFLRTILSESRKVFASPLNRVYQYEILLREDASEVSVQLIRSCLESLLLTLCESQPSVQQAELRNTVVRQLIAFLDENTDKRLTMQTISYRFGYSPAWLQHIFKAETGQSIIQYFISRKIDKAKRLIAEGDFSVAEISDMLGYDTPQYFSRQFKELTNMTPSAYAESVKETGILE